jgi:acetolactate synthase small subunit
MTAYSPDSTTACFAVRADADPGMLSRVVELFAKRGMVPASVHSRLSGAGHDPSLLIDIQVDGLDVQAGEQIAEALRQIPFVERVLTARKRSTRAA